MTTKLKAKIIIYKINSQPSSQGLFLLKFQREKPWERDRRNFMSKVHCLENKRSSVSRYSRINAVKCVSTTQRLSCMTKQTKNSLLCTNSFAKKNFLKYTKQQTCLGSSSLIHCSNIILLFGVPHSKYTAVPLPPDNSCQPKSHNTQWYHDGYGNDPGFGTFSFMLFCWCYCRSCGHLKTL